jgi:hypothetical protein
VSAKAFQKALPNIWYTKLAMQRYLTDHVAELLDPNWQSKQRSIRKRMYRDKGQSWWWRPGDTSPE